MSRLDELVMNVARTKRRVDRIGGLLILSENAYKVALRELDRAIADACRTADEVAAARWRLIERRVIKARDVAEGKVIVRKAAT